VLELVRELCRDHDLAAIYVSHDLAVVADVADHVTVMYGGQVVESGTNRDVLTRAAHPYTRALLAAVPSTTHRHRLVPIPGHIPAPDERRPGCVFATRCGHAIAECEVTRPALVPGPSGTLARCLRTAEIASTPKALHHPYETHTRSADGPNLLSVSGLNAGHAGRQVLFDVSLRLARGECVALVGESGSGKTTMARCLVGLHEEQEGTLTFEGRPVPATASKRDMTTRRELQYIFQNPYGSLSPHRSVERTLIMPLRHYFGVSAREARTRVREALERVEIPSWLGHRYPAELSGGQRQRVAIARALVCEPKLLICDEVTSALDVSVQASVVELLRALLRDGLSMIFVTHDLAVARNIADSVIVLSQGRVVESGPTDPVLTKPSHPHTQRLIAATLNVPDEAHLTAQRSCPC